MHWPECKRLVLKLTMVVEIWALLSRHRPPLLECSLRLPVEVQLLGKANKDSDNTTVITVVHWRLHAKTHRAGKVVSAVSVSERQRSRLCGQNLSGAFFRLYWLPTSGKAIGAMAANSRTKALVSPPPLWVSAQLLSGCVTASSIAITTV